MAAVQERAAQRTLNDPVCIRFTREGVPLAVRWDGRLWPVAAEPVRWTSGWNWSETDPAGTGPGQGRLVEIEYWRLPVPAASSLPLRILEVRRHPGWEGWHLIRVCDG